MNADVVYVLPDKLGGVFNFCANLLGHRRAGGLRHGAVVTHNRWSRDVRADEPLPADWQCSVEEELPRENLFAALRRVRDAIAGTGALVANDWIELASVAAFPVDRTVFSIVHGDFDYYYDLAARHDADVDVFITYTEAIRQRLAARLPHRVDDIECRRYGVQIRGRRQRAMGPLRLLYAGRLDVHKGVFDLPLIDARLRAGGVDVTWTVQGTGPDEQRLRAEWRSPAVHFTGRRAMQEVLDGYERHDVLVMPSRGEGLPVVLLEAGAAGMVPVASDLPSGIPEVVRHGETGWRAPVGDIEGFAAAIASCAADRQRLEAMSVAMRDLIVAEWDIRMRALEYEALVEQWRERRGPRRPHAVPYGSRLDQRWLPNALVRAIRSRRIGASGV